MTTQAKRTGTEIDMDALIKEIQKQTEKLIIQSCVAVPAISKVQSKVAKLNQSTKDTLTVTKSSIDNVANDMSSSLKGEWGTKAKECLSKNSEKLTTI